MDDKVEEEDLRGEDFERFKAFQQREMRLENSIQHLLYSLLSLSQYIIWNKIEIKLIINMPWNKEIIIFVTTNLS